MRVFGQIMLVKFGLSIVAATVHGPRLPSQGYTLPAGSVITNCAVSGTAALTFDDGPHIFTSHLIDELNAIGARATFFVCGQLYGCLYDLERIRTLEKAFYASHQIASHTWSHAALDTLALPDLDSEISRLETALDDILGVRPRWMRPPYGRWNQSVRTYMAERDYKIALWSVDTEDWNNLAPEESYERVRHDNGTGLIPLMHDPIEGTSKQLGIAIAKWAQTNQIRLVTLSECMGEHQPDGAYERVGPPRARSLHWNCS